VGSGDRQLVVELDGEEVPIMDGSAEPFAQANQAPAWIVLSFARRGDLRGQAVSA
jgi:UDP-3-O-acyl-N-acetylglucosamine deacetylase